MSAPSVSGTADRSHSFTMVYNVVIDHYHLGPQELALYTAIARHINHESGQAWPSLSRLSQISGMARGTVIKYLKALEDKGLVQITRHCKRGTKERAANLYRLLIPDQSPAEQLALPAAESTPAPQPEVVQDVNHPSSQVEPQVVHDVDGNQIDFELDLENQTKRGPAQRAGSEPPPDSENGSAPQNGAALQARISSQPEKETWNSFCRVLAEVCRLDLDSNKGKIQRFASTLWQRGHGYKTADLRWFEAWWYAHDWRGRKGDIPRLDEVTQGIKIAVEAQQPTLEERRYRYLVGEYAAHINY